MTGGLTVALAFVTVPLAVFSLEFGPGVNEKKEPRVTLHYWQ